MFICSPNCVLEGWINPSNLFSTRALYLQNVNPSQMYLILISNKSLTSYFWRLKYQTTALSYQFNVSTVYLLFLTVFFFNVETFVYKGFVCIPTTWNKFELICSKIFYYVVSWWITSYRIFTKYIIWKSCISITKVLFLKLF